jgi:L-ascorbate metabolism protein UlaG (beta-lactamase superfamily)
MSPTNFNTTLHITHLTTATSILEIDGVNFITDPVFADAPAEYDITDIMPEGTEKTILKYDEGPALKLNQIPPIDVVLLSHEDHIDNLDDEGRKLLDGRRVITTPDGAKNLAQAVGNLDDEPERRRVANYWSSLRPPSRWRGHWIYPP